MSDTRDPERDQVAPVPNDGPSCHDLVIADMQERKEFGFNKYQSLLQPHNGRSFLQDAYEEVMDLAVYLRGRLEEEKAAEVASHGVCTHMAVIVRANNDVQMIASGPKSWCYGKLVEWVAKHPLGEYDEASVLGYKQKLEERDVELQREKNHVSVD